MATTSHHDIATILAVLGVLGYMGGAVANSISGAIWTHTLPGALQRLLPEYVVEDWSTIYDDLEVQLSYPMGDPVRDAIIEAYSTGQRRILRAGTVIVTSSLVWVLSMRNINVSEIQQVKGVLLLILNKYFEIPRAEQSVQAKMRLKSESGKLGSAS